MFYSQTQAYRRSYQRFIVEAPASLVINDNLEKPIILRDLSVKGGQAFVNYRLDKDQKVTLNLKAPLFSSPVSQIARVAWCKEVGHDFWQLGLDFTQNILLKNL